MKKNEIAITETKNGDVVILTIVGKILLGEGDVQLNNTIMELINRNELKILLNLALVPYLDSGGFGEISRSWTRVKREGGELKLCGVTPRVRDVLAVTKLAYIFDIFDNQDDAVANFS